MITFRLAPLQRSWFELARIATGSSCGEYQGPSLTLKESSRSVRESAGQEGLYIERDYDRTHIDCRL